MSDSRKRRSGGAKSSRMENGDYHRSQQKPSHSNQQNQRPKTLSGHGQKYGGYDYVRQIVQEEGRTARNLVQYSVPMLEHGDGASQRPPYHKRGGSTSRSHSHRTPPPGSRTRHRSLSDIAKSPRSVSSSSNKNIDLRARYWKYMFDNFQRAVDSIYQTCEQDESVVECKEVIMMLEQSTKDFTALIERLNMLRAYEDSAKDGDRPQAVAWEVRKMSPHKTAPKSPGPAQSQSGNSWADKVKGCRVLTFSSPTKSSSLSGQTVSDKVKSLPSDVSISSDATDETVTSDSVDEGGWETVQRGRMRARYSPSQKSTENLAVQSKNTKRSLMRSLSVPNQDQGATEKEKKTQANTLRAVSEKHLTETIADPEKGSKHVLPKESAIDNNSVLNQVLDTHLDLESLDNSIKDSLEFQLDEDLVSSQLQAAQESALAYAVQEEENWLKELAREQSLQVDVQADAMDDSISDLGTTNSSLESSNPIKDWDSLVALHEAEMTKSSTSWGELVVEAEEARTPGHGVHMHEKLSSPSRKRSPTESRRRHELKQAKAQQLRGKLMQEKADRLRELSKKVAEVKAYKEELMRQSKSTLEHKLKRAENKRQLQLKNKARKAHEEEAKANEIAFINSLEAQNKRHDILSKHQESEARLHDLMEERQRKHEEKQAKEAAVEERRKALEAERKARLLEMQEKRKLRDARIELQKQEKETERKEVVMAKGKEREERIAALNAQQEINKQELQKKIQQKKTRWGYEGLWIRFNDHQNMQSVNSSSDNSLCAFRLNRQDETTQRHDEYLQHIRDRAFEMSIMLHSTEDHNDAPKLTPYDRHKLCKICNVLIPSEVYLLSHLRGKKHQEALKENNSGRKMTKQEIETFNLKHIVDAPDNSNHPQIVTEKERQKALRKRCKKLRQRMVTRGLEYENSSTSKQQLAESEHKAKLQKIVKDISKYLQSQDSGPWPQAKVAALDRALGEIARILEKKNANDLTSFRVLGGFSSLSRILLKIEDSSDNLPCVIPSKSLAHSSEVLRLACKNNFDSCHYMLFSNKIGALVDHLIHRLNMIIPDDFDRLSPRGGGGGCSNGYPASGGSDVGVGGEVGVSPLPFDPVCSSLMQTLAAVLTCLAKNNPAATASEASSERMSGTADVFTNRGNDIISYIVSVGVVDKLRLYLSAVRGPPGDEGPADTGTADFLLHSLGLLVAMTKFMSKRNANVFCSKRPEDPSQLIHTFEVTELCGIVSLLYGMLLHSGAPSRSPESRPRELSASTVSIILTGLRMLNNMAVLDLHMLQRTLGGEGISLEFRHIASYLTWYCTHCTHEELLHEVLLCVGYTAVLCPDNQVIIQSGQPPTVLQQLCNLPFPYFSDPRLVTVLLPCIVACCYNNASNTRIVEQELSTALLANFIEERQLEQHQTSKPQSSPQLKKSKTTASDQKEVREAENRMALSLRFPVEHWESAKQYFSVPLSADDDEEDCDVAP